MNREILFRAKRKNNGKWVEGYCVPHIVEGKIVHHFILTGEADLVETEDDELILKFYWEEIDQDTLCQFTGLVDKNGQKIWENDICDRKEKYPEIVTLNKGDWQLDYSYVFGKEMHSDACNLGFYACERKCVEVIGNIFDNPELLEVE